MVNFTSHNVQSIKITQYNPLVGYTNVISYECCMETSYVFVLVTEILRNVFAITLGKGFHLWLFISVYHNLSYEAAAYFAVFKKFYFFSTVHSKLRHIPIFKIPRAQTLDVWIWSFASHYLFPNVRGPMVQCDWLPKAHAFKAELKHKSSNISFYTLFLS